ncbi:MAG: hypothetical protein ACFCUG_00170 [Thiotrichales bacterium]
MTGCPPDAPTLSRFIAQIDTTRPRPHHSALLALAGNCLPMCDFRYALTRGGWYRPGGVIAANGTRIAGDLERWAETELDACGGDMELFLDRFDDAGLLATRITGRTHFFVAAIGAAPTEFLQLEVEELQEEIDRSLFTPDDPPADLQELIDPITPCKVAAHPVGRSYYHYRRLTDIRQVSASLAQPVEGEAPLARFLDEWSRSSAARRAHFSEHWILALREHHDRYHNLQLFAAPISLHARKLKSFHWHPEAQGVELSEQLLAFDRAAGYLGAWYFHLVAGALTPRAVAYAVRADLEAGFEYLPDSEAALVRNWVEAPYSI